MFMLEWLFNLLPSWFWNGIIILGIALMVASWFLKFFPGISIYKTPAAILGVLVTVLGVYHLGGSENEARWQEKMKVIQARIDEAEAAAKKQNVIIVTKYVNRTKTIKEKGDTINNYIDREVVKYDANCPVPASVVKAHNAAAQGVAIQ